MFIGRAMGLFWCAVRFGRSLQNYVLASIVPSILSVLYVLNLGDSLPITATGPQDEQPSLDMINASERRRQSGPVTLEKGLDLVLCGTGS